MSNPLLPEWYVIDDIAVYADKGVVHTMTERLVTKHEIDKAAGVAELRLKLENLEIELQMAGESKHYLRETVAELRQRLATVTEQRDKLLAAAKLLVEPFVPWQFSKGMKFYRTILEHDTCLALDYGVIHEAITKAIAACSPKPNGDPL